MPTRSFIRYLLGAIVLILAGRANAQYVNVDHAVVNVSALQPGQQAVAALVLTVKPHFHMESHVSSNPKPFEAHLTSDLALVIYAPVYPAGKKERYKSAGDDPIDVYTGTITVYIPFQVRDDAKPGAIKIEGKFSYQACDENFCYQPTTASFAIDANIVAPGQTVAPQNAEIFKGLDSKLLPQKSTITLPTSAPAAEPSGEISTNISLPKTADISQPFLLASLYSRGDLKSIIHEATHGGVPGKLVGSDWSIGYAFGIAFVVGLLFNIMPCVLPVLPLKAIGFYEVGQHKRSRSFMFGVVFSCGIIAVFAILAVPIIVLKEISWGQLFSESWFIWPMVGLLVAMGFGLFGAFTFSLPVGTYNFQPRHDTFSGNFLLGGFTAILATPCTAPLLPPLLVWAASQPKLGVPAMIMVGVGMSSPYLILSALPELARKFPRTGPWSELFKQMMGFMLLAAAAFFAAGHVMTSANYWWVVAAVVVLAAIFLIFRTVQLSPKIKPVIISSILAVGMVVGMLWWTVRVTGFGEARVEEAFQPYTPEAFDSARQQHKVVLVKFTANWCATCQVIEGTVFHSAATWENIRENNVVALKADFSNENPAAQTLLNHLSISGGIPLTAVYPPLPVVR